MGEDLKQALNAHGYQASHVDSAMAFCGDASTIESESIVATGYWLSRLQGFLQPWRDLRDYLCSSDDVSMHRLPALRHWMSQCDALSQTCHANNTLEPLNQLLATCRAIKTLTGEPQMDLKPFQAVILVEGATEALQLPYLLQQWRKASEDSNSLNAEHSFTDAPVAIIEAGGKNAFAAVYHQWSAMLRIPIMILADADAQDAIDNLRPEMRAIDTHLVLSPGAWEDIYPLPWLVATLNRVYQPYPLLDVATLEAKLSFLGVGQAVATLEALWREYDWGSFDKVRFAKDMMDTLEKQPHLLSITSKGLRKLKTALADFLQQSQQDWWTPWL